MYKGCIQLIPHKKFTFAKIWLMYAKFEIRQMDLPAARKALGMALGMCPKEKLFKGYIELELEVCLISISPYPSHVILLFKW